MTGSPLPRRIAILAGGGSLPQEIAYRLKARGDHVHILAINGAAEIKDDATLQTSVDFAQIGKILSVLKNDKLTEMLIIGSVKRPDLANIKPDLGFFRAVPTVIRLIRAGGDDAVLRGVIAFFEKHGVRIVGPADVVPELLVSSGPLGRHGANSQQKLDIAKGLAVIRRLAPFDVGQGVVVAQGVVLAVEGAEGTDRMLQRLVARRANQNYLECGVLTKGPKPGQEMRIDLPTIGPNTVHNVQAAGLSGIAVAVGCTLTAERNDLRNTADAAGVYVEGVALGELQKRAKADRVTLDLQVFGRRRASATQRSDCIKGGGVLTVLAQEGVAAAATVVHRAHVLAIETGEGIDQILLRSGDLRQWGRGVWMRNAGVTVLADSRDLDATLLARAAETGLAGIAVMLGDSALAIERKVIEEADKRGLFIAGLTWGQGEPG
ncbi:hypothetical protein SAMN04488061_2630 [Filomicrobium insigne]|uniref:DUF1009 domain-containing protein n=1 Tax=Filomicrobium insigne TaxID=418854 RepID=A0A1H0R6L5_9HYPH|nr:UDP-2,3-diacylglucosamine diphosphatase LpxI [Filomicrobium insigne]SDP25141.1 hypothetical protein SAMN04488061_2630 [Filomicrobium insigne]